MLWVKVYIYMFGYGYYVAGLIQVYEEVNYFLGILRYFKYKCYSCYEIIGGLERVV